MPLFRFFLLVMLTLPGAIFAQGQFTVAPTHVTLDISRPSVSTFLVSNTGESRLHVGITPIFLTVDSSSLRLGHVLPGHDQTQDSLVPYITVSPRALSLAPGEQREVRMAVRPTAALQTGAYRAHLLFHQINKPLSKHPSISESASQQMSMHLDMQIEMAVSVYGTKGQGDTNLQFSCQRQPDKTVIIKVRNVSPWRFEGNLKVTDGKQSKEIDLVLLRDTERHFSNTFHTSAKTIELYWLADKPYRGKGHTHCPIA